MFEIFIPTELFFGGEKNTNLQINPFSEKLSQVLQGFDTLSSREFQSRFFSGVHIDVSQFDENLIVLCNGGFGNHYFVDYDVIEHSEHKESIMGVKLLGQNEIVDRIQNVMLDIAEITAILSSDRLLTHSKKEQIREKVISTLFTLSGIVFLLYQLLEKTSKNLEVLSSMKSQEEYDAQARLFQETSKTKEVELRASIDKLEGKIELFLGVVGRIL